ncbi:MAG: ferritin-like domain-containing protein [Thermoplasmatota archaeon]
MYEKLKTISFKEILGYSIEGEEDAYKAYMTLAEKMEGLVSERFKSLARDEKMHKKELLKLHEKEFGDQDYILPEDEEDLPPHEGAMIKVNNVQNLIDALDKSMKAEYNAYRIYKYLADNKVKYATLFEYLAVMEKGHYETLKAEKSLYERPEERKKERRIRPFGEQTMGTQV